MVGYWGQNGAGPANGPANYEKPLLEVFRTTKYDILAVSFVIVFFDARNKGILGSQPRENFSRIYEITEYSSQRRGTLLFFH